MNTINILDIQTANLIAAGEVVDRPSSAVKEMLENSIDAGATKITVEIKNGGTSLMRVTDNGCGMSGQDALMCIKRHATSKIKSAADLSSISTLGFRGEALAAISAVSDMRILTRQKDSQLGTLVVVKSGAVVSSDEAGGPVGTTIIVENLFSSVPARRKFLRRDAAETASVSAVAEKIALSRPDISVKYIADGAVKFVTDGSGRLINAISAVLGRDFASKLVPVEGEYDGIKTLGYVGTPENSRATRAGENFFINGRYVRCQTASAALEQAFSSYIPKEKFPVAVLSVFFSPALVDVNVHPQKLEVKFSDERPVFSSVYWSVREALKTRIPRPGVSPDGDTDKSAAAQSSRWYRENDEQLYVRASSPQEAARIASEHEESRKSFEQLPLTPVSSERFSTAAVENSTQQVNRPAQKEENSLFTTERSADSDTTNGGRPVQNGFPQPVDMWKTPEKPTDPGTADESQNQNRNEPEDLSYRIQGVLFNCYILVEQGKNLIVIDKHAAHERIIFERLKGNMSLESPPSQRLLLPMEVRLDSRQLDTALEYAAELASVGFEYSDGKIYSYPIALSSGEAREVFEILVGRLSEGVGDLDADRRTMYERALYQASCKAAVKAGREDLYENIDWIVRQVLTRPEIRYCPHGRPVAVQLTESDFEKRFERK